MRHYFIAAVTAFVLASCSQEERAAKEQVLNALKDPASAQWKEVDVIASNLVCGQVNAKNGMGGYGGFTNFMVRDGTLYLGDPDDSAGISRCCSVIKAHMTEPTHPKYTKALVHESCDQLSPSEAY